MKKDEVPDSKVQGNGLGHWLLLCCAQPSKIITFKQSQEILLSKETNLQPLGQIKMEYPQVVVLLTLEAKLRFCPFYTQADPN